MKRAIKIVSVAAVIAVALFGLYIFNLVKSVRFVDQVVAEKISVAGAWVDVTPPRPLKAVGRSQYLSITVEGAERQSARVEAPGTERHRPGEVRLADGTVTVPEIQLIAEGGRTYDLTPVSQDYAGIAFSPSPDTQADFERAAPFKLVRVRSDAPILISKMTWHCRAAQRR